MQKTSRGGEYIKRLIDFIRQEYGIDAVSLTPAKRGFYGETWKIVSPPERVFFVKLVYRRSHKAVYERSFPVILHLNNHGIDFISRVVKTINGDLYARFDGAVLGVFEWIDGENEETDDTKFFEYEMLAKIYAVPKPGFRMRREEFTTINSEKFMRQWDLLDNGELKPVFEKRRSTLVSRAERHRKFAGICRSGANSFVITHGDAGGNFIRGNGKNYIVDWDAPLLSPPERDAWVMCGKAWARAMFENAMKNNGMDYTLKPERLTYYCYDFFFFYLKEYLGAAADAKTVAEFLDGWINDSLNYADGL